MRSAKPGDRSSHLEVGRFRELGRSHPLSGICTSLPVEPDTFSLKDFARIVRPANARPRAWISGCDHLTASAISRLDK
ncbi:hypothetical protein [Amycolatopsis saalfeldensis]|uniref:Uncharacterized protein n=1 Tax=Amycolatopsis saalfeldensis TaxID=394193 RepID=A0A1H8YKJ1_9PSEU|nr:hypothetical protein [Amycolatopsis saalfeldensis]SEP52724.1 hypothetical protein SAMN04489732_1229 [Amycolatopsis saalfeldensis]